MQRRLTKLAGRVASLLLACGPMVTQAQSIWLDRLAGEGLAVTSPAARVLGEPGSMRIAQTACRAQPAEGLRQRIVNISLQEWAYFGFNVADETVLREPIDEANPFAGRRGFPRGFSWLDMEQSSRLAPSIAGYWASTADGAWILDRQNEVWESGGVGARWRDPWSAAFISWVMCEGGVSEQRRFARAINHHTYIDQAIRARDGSGDAVFFAYDVGEQPIEPGDMLCAGRRPTYASLAERRVQLGEGIRSHCDIVVKVEPGHSRILAVGGNVRGTVALKLLPAGFTDHAADGLRARSVGRGRGQIFAHLKLRAMSVDADALGASPTLRRVGEQPEMLARVRAALDHAGRDLGASVLQTGTHYD